MVDRSEYAQAIGAGRVDRAQERSERVNVDAFVLRDVGARVDSVALAFDDAVVVMLEDAWMVHMGYLRVIDKVMQLR
jgi:hypothetical protein